MFLAGPKDHGFAGRHEYEADLRVLQKAFSTVGLSAGDWLFCAAVASSVLWVRELGKMIIRMRVTRYGT